MSIFVPNLNKNVNMSDFASEPEAALTYGMSDELRNSGLLSQVRNLSHEDKACLIRYIYITDKPETTSFEELEDGIRVLTVGHRDKIVFSNSPTGWDIETKRLSL